MPDLLIPLGRVFKRDPSVPLALQGQMHGVPEGVDELAYTLGGRDKKPHRPIFFYGPHGEPIILIGAGEADAAELEDLAQEAIHKAQIDFAAKREQYGYPSRESFDPLFREALRDRMKKHKQNPITDPPRVVGKRR